MWKTIFPQLLGAAGSLPTRVLGCVHLTRVVVHFVNQDTNCFRIGVLVDAVAKVKDMAAIADLAEAVDYAARFTTDASLVGKKHFCRKETRRKI